MPKFTIICEGKILGTHLISKNLITIGRAKDNTICISNNTISRRHVKIEKQGKCYVLEDTDSLNGTYVNDNKVKSIVLCEGDRIILGKYTVLFEEENHNNVGVNEPVSCYTNECLVDSAEVDNGEQNGITTGPSVDENRDVLLESKKIEQQTEESLEITTELAGHDPFIVLLKLKGSVLGKGEKKIRNHIDGLFVGGTANLLIDLATVSKISDSAWMFLAQQRTRAQQNDGDLKLIGLSTSLLKQCEILNLRTQLDIYDSVNDAVKAFGKFST